MNKREEKIVGATIEDLRTALNLIEDALDYVSFFNDYQRELLDTDNGPIDVRIEEIRSDIMQKIRSLERKMNAGA